MSEVSSRNPPSSEGDLLFVYGRNLQYCEFRARGCDLGSDPHLTLRFRNCKVQVTALARSRDIAQEVLVAVLPKGGLALRRRLPVIIYRRHHHASARFSLNDQD